LRKEGKTRKTGLCPLVDSLPKEGVAKETKTVDKSSFFNSLKGESRAKARGDTWVFGQLRKWRGGRSLSPKKEKTKVSHRKEGERGGNSRTCPRKEKNRSWLSSLSQKTKIPPTKKQVGRRYRGFDLVRKAQLSASEGLP